MNNTAGKYNWLRDAGIVLLVLSLVFYFDPVRKVFIAMGGLEDGGFFFILTAGVIVALTSMIISLRHYWKWVVITTIGIAAMVILNDYIEDYEYCIHVSFSWMLFKKYLFDSLVNGLFCFISALPLAKGVRVIRKQREEAEAGQNNVLEKYNWRRDAGIVLLALLLVLCFDPFNKLFSSVNKYEDGLSFLWVVTTVVALVSAFTAKRYYWHWAVITAFGTAAVTILNDFIQDFDYYIGLAPTMNLYELYIYNSLGNGMVCLLFALPAAKGVLLIKEKLRR